MDASSLRLEISKLPAEVLQQVKGTCDAINPGGLLGFEEVVSAVTTAITVWERLRVTSCSCAEVTALDSDHLWFIPARDHRFQGPYSPSPTGCPMHGDGPWTVAHSREPM